MVIDGLMLMLVIALLGAVIVCYLAFRAKIADSNNKVSEARYLLALMDFNDTYMAPSDRSRYNHLVTKLEEYYTKRDTELTFKEMIYNNQSLIKIAEEVIIFDKEIRLTMELYDKPKQKKRGKQSWE